MEAAPPPPPGGTGLSLPVPVRWTEDGKAILVLDQTALPERELWLLLASVAPAQEAIRALRARPAPPLAITREPAAAALAGRGRHGRGGSPPCVPPR